MQTAGKRSADSRITLATVARADCVSTGRGRESGVYLSTDLTGTRPYFRLPQSRLLRESREHRNRAVGSSGWLRKWWIPAKMDSRAENGIRICHLCPREVIEIGTIYRDQIDNVNKSLF